MDQKTRAIFDPQFFIPSIARGKLSTYGFYPQQAAGGDFSTDEYPEEAAHESAEGCVAFQARNNFRYIVIPTRYYPGMPTDFTENQQRLFVDPFLRVIQNQAISQQIALQLVVNGEMIRDSVYSQDILNWVTNIERISAVYLIVEFSPRFKQINEIDDIYSLLNFISTLSQKPNELDVILGYLNTEALVLSIASPKIVTIGSFENTRMFNIRNFQEKKVGSFTASPNPRFYVSRLIQLIDKQYINTIRREVDDPDRFFDRNRYQAIMFDRRYVWNSKKPEPYKHYFLEFSKQLRRIGRMDGIDRYNEVTKMLQSALETYAALGIPFDSNSNDSHLAAWLNAARLFARDQGWV